MSLVADYGTDSDSEETENADDQTDNVQCAAEESSGGKNYLVSVDVEQSSSDDEGANVKDYIAVAKEKLPNPLMDNLPSPLDDSNSSSSNTGTVGSVFSNPFENAEMSKRSILEKHVKMTEAQLRTGKKAKVCKAFKQGRCRFGKHCQYSHDLDANLSARYKCDETVEQDAGKELPDQSRLPKHLRLPPPPQQKGFMGTFDTLHTGRVVTPQQRAKFLHQQRHMNTVNVEDDDKFNVGDKRKKRAGLSQTLVPPKRAMSHLNKQRETERPWTMQK